VDVGQALFTFSPFRTDQNTIAFSLSLLNFLEENYNDRQKKGNFVFKNRVAVQAAMIEPPPVNRRFIGFPKVNERILRS